jgi:hypothetical protein
MPANSRSNVFAPTMNAMRACIAWSGLQSGSCIEDRSHRIDCRDERAREFVARSRTPVGKRSGLRLASLLSFLLPQWWSLRAGLNWRTCPRFNARMIPMRANIVGPLRSATSMSSSMATCHSGNSASALGRLVMWSAVAKGDQAPTSGQRDRLVELAAPAYLVICHSSSVTSNRRRWRGARP